MKSFFNEIYVMFVSLVFIALGADLVGRLALDLELIWT